MDRNHPTTGLLERVGAVNQVSAALRFVWDAASGWMIARLGLVAIQAVLPLAGLYLIKLIVDAVSNSVSDPSAGQGFQDVLVLIFLAAFIALLTAVTRAISGFVSEAQAQLVTDHVADVLHEKSAAVDFGYYEDPRYYDTLHRAQQEAPHRPTRLVANLTLVCQSTLTATGIVILLATVHWVLAAVILLAVFPALFVRARHAGRMYRWQRDRSPLVRTSSYIGWLLTQAPHAKEVRLYELGDELRKRFRAVRTVIREERLRLARQVGIENAATQIVASIVVFGSYALIAWQTVSGPLTVGDLVMYFGAVQRGQSTLQSLFAGLGSLYEDNLFLSNLTDFLNIEDRVVAPSKPRSTPHPIREGIEFRSVTFAYPQGARPVLQEVSMRVRPGEMVALVGSNGSGKTSLVKLLCRLYDPDEGSVTLDGIDLRNLDPVEYRRRIGVVFQDYAKYSLSAMDNIGFGDAARLDSSDQIRHAARMAGVDQVLEGLPRGYDTLLGRLFPEGEELSTGEWQKVALARAFFSDTDLLVVDEPTSALDAEAEAEVFRSIRDLIRNRAAVVISHRFSTVRMADRIYVMDRGRIVENGSHEELVSLGGTYARLFHIQAAPYVSTTARDWETGRRVNESSS